VLPGKDHRALKGVVIVWSHGGLTIGEEIRRENPALVLLCPSLISHEVKYDRTRDSMLKKPVSNKHRSR
jgi:hypothetical protein